MMGVESGAEMRELRPPTGRAQLMIEEKKKRHRGSVFVPWNFPFRAGVGRMLSHPVKVECAVCQLR
jgi:hypothetical protein